MPGAERTSWFVSDESHTFGSGWFSGTIGAVLGLAGLFASTCLAWPQVLTAPALRGHWPNAMLAVVAAALALAFAAGLLSLLLRRKKTLGVIATGSALLGALVLAFVPRAHGSGSPIGLGVDVFALNLLLYSALFVPLERMWPQRPEQPTFRPEWWTDLAWFASSALLVQLTTFLVLAPGNAVSALAPAALQRAVCALPLPVQFVLIVVASDVVQYWIHRACHRTPWLWRYHSIHHSATAMDWPAGSRLHVVDAVLTRALVYGAIAVAGFDLRAIAAYLVFVAVQATFVHANVSWRLPWLERYLVTPRFHHWHHAESPPDVNFAVHLPWLDRLFGTFHLPADDWPQRYGLANGAEAPRGFWRQLVAPFRASAPR